MGVRPGIIQSSCALYAALMVAATNVAAESVQARATDNCHSVVVSADPEFPPFAWYDGERLRGAGVEVVTSALTRMHLPYEVRYVGPFARLLGEAKKGNIDIVAELKQTPDRQPYLAFSKTPIFINPSAVFVSVESSLQINSRDDLVPLHGGVTHGTRFGDSFDEFLATSLHTEEAPGIKENFAKLQARRIDYFVSPYYPAVSYLNAQHLDDRFVALKPFVASVDNFVGWSRRSPCLARMAEFDQTLAAMAHDGDIERALEQGQRSWRQNPVMTR
ncbi:MAG: transporter substrate-binding domain-containing protein [Burkholderiales bacterium]|nr:transporter substrate-binding domain-containing protein [Burkholderiales bacterium]